MDFSYSTILETEHTISDLEKKIEIKQKKASIPSLVHVVWICIDPADTWLLLGSAGDGGFTTLSDNVKFKRARHVPITLRYAESCRLHLRFKGEIREQTFRALDKFVHDPKLILKKVQSGSLVLGTDQQPPWKLEDTTRILHILEEVLIDTTQDICCSIESAFFEAPYEHLRGFEISVNPVKTPKKSDVIWIIVPPGTLSDEESDSLRKVLQETNCSTIIPLLGLPWKHLHDREQELNNPLLIKQYLDGIETRLKEITTAVLFPALTLCCDSFIPGYTTCGKYEQKCFEKLWQVTRSAGYYKSAWHDTTMQRYEHLVSVMMEPPKSILGLLRQRSYLRSLQSIPQFQFNFSDNKDFIVLQKEGIHEYVELIEKSTVLIKEKIEQDEAIQWFESASQALVSFFEEVKDAECFQGEREDFIKLVTEISNMGNQRGKPQVISKIDHADTLFDRAKERLDSLRENTLQLSKKLEKLKTTLNTGISLEKREEIDHAVMFWSEFVPTTLKKIKIKEPKNDIMNICTKAKDEFNDYLSLTSTDEREFNKCKYQQWPLTAKKMTEKMNNLLDDTINLWLLHVNQELSNIEEFRTANLPDEPKILRDVDIKTGTTPVLKESLEVSITKKPGIISKLFYSTADFEKWREQTIEDLSHGMKSIVDTYRSEVYLWLKKARNKIQRIITDIESKTKKASDSAKQKLEEFESIQTNKESEHKRLSNEYNKKIKVLSELDENFKKYTQIWDETKHSIM